MIDWKKVVKTEKFIEKEYGKEATATIGQIPWDEQKEKLYLEQSEEAERRRFNARYTKEEEDFGEFKIIKKSNKESPHVSCPICDSQVLKVLDDIYLNKYEACEKCFIDFIEDREDRWESGWRPDEIRVQWALNKRK